MHKSNPVPQHPKHRDCGCERVSPRVNDEVHFSLGMVNVDIVEKVTVQREKFLRFLSSRVEDRATAEDILQAAYVKAVEHGSEIRAGESSVSWFYRILRNAVTDHYRRRAARAKAHEVFAGELPQTYEPEVKSVICKCIGEVIENLKPEYRDAIEQVDLGETPVEVFAQSQQISPNNASVRLFRARKSVAKHLMRVCGACAEHKCLDCTCRRSEV